MVGDSHASIVKNITRLARKSDQPIAALLTDLKQRGMLADTPVIRSEKWGERPRSRLERKILVAAVGTIASTDTASGCPVAVSKWAPYGATDDFGMAVTENKVELHDRHATILHQMGCDHKRLTYRYSGREFHLSDVPGDVVTSILA
jgi:hypothetical protein